MASDHRKDVETHNSLKDIFKDFVGYTTVHALPNAVFSSKLAFRLCWAFVFLIGCTAFVYQLHTLVDLYFKFEKTVQLEITFEPLVFPAVTFCSLNPYETQKAEEIPQIKSLMKAYDSAIDRINKKYNGNMERKKRETPVEFQLQKVIGTYCYEIGETSWVSNPQANEPCFCIETYCAPVNQWLFKACLRAACHATTRSCPKLFSIKPIASSTSFIDCLCPIFRSDCYAQSAIDDSVYEFQDKPSRTTIPVNTTLLSANSSSSSIKTSSSLTTFEITTAEGVETPITTENENTAVTMFEQITTVEPEVEEGTHDKTTQTTIAENIVTNLTKEPVLLTTKSILASPFITEANQSGFLVPDGEDFEMNPDLLDMYTNWLKEMLNESTNSRAQLAKTEFDWAFRDIDDELALQANAKETVVFIGGELTKSQRKHLSYDQSSIIKQCTFNGNPCDMNRDFKLLMDPLYGNCYTYNHNKTNAVKSSRSGEPYGLKVMIGSPVNTYMFTTDSAGVRVTVHTQDELPFPDVFGYYAPVGFISAFGIWREDYVRLSEPYDYCMEDKHPGDYLFEGEYSIEGCMRSCHQRAILLRCNCTDPRYPQLDGQMQNCPSEDSIARKFSL